MTSVRREVANIYLLFIFRFIAGSVLDNGGRHASLLTTMPRGVGHPADSGTQLRENGGSLAGQKVNYLDSGYSEEDQDQQVTSCLMKTSSGSIYIPGSKFSLMLKKNLLLSELNFAENT